MPLITFTDANGQSRTIEAAPGQSLMQAAVSANLAGIVGECGGAAMCATCHVYVDGAWLSRMPSMQDSESELLDFVSSPRQPNSRLSCQLQIQPDWSGLRVTLPAEQG